MSIKFGSLLLARRTIIMRIAYNNKKKLICQRNLSTLVSNFRLSNGLVDMLPIFGTESIIIS